MNCFARGWKWSSLNWGRGRIHMTMGAIQILRPNWNVLTTTININATASRGPSPVTANSLCAHKLSEVVKSGETVTVEASWLFPSGVSPHTALSCYDLIFALPPPPSSVFMVSLLVLGGLAIGRKMLWAVRGVQATVKRGVFCKADDIQESMPTYDMPIRSRSVRAH